MGMVGHHALPELPASSQLQRLQTSGTPQGLLAVGIGSMADVDANKLEHDVR
jgi:hypothetical protein